MQMRGGWMRRPLIIRTSRPQATSFLQRQRRRGPQQNTNLTIRLDADVLDWLKR